ncbi:uncharacterized protein LOC110980972 [Acanthaster planci]|uniref:Uncharacterized protein LOC110980972 n=1 Tax=Acanthaster planci TaxID=133434 RepID=A0A8B7YMU4_ACAPL|nr:uncharacterized protein LOC110980972 [Acanthaster planci]
MAATSFHTVCSHFNHSNHPGDTRILKPSFRFHSTTLFIMRGDTFFPGLLLIASLVYLTVASPTSRATQEHRHADIVVLANQLPWELRVLYDIIISPSTDEIRRENYIWRAFELLKYKKYKAYVWFYDWLVYQSGYDGRGPGRHTPRGGPGGRTHRHGRGGPGGRTRGHGGPGRRTPRGGRHHHGRH